MSLKGDHVGTTDEAAPAYFQCPKAAVADQLGDGLTRDAPNTRSICLADPLGGVNFGSAKIG